MVYNKRYGVYVTKDGNVFRVARTARGDHITGALYSVPVALDPSTGYLKITAYNPETKKSRPVAVHQLVAETFLKPVDGCRYVDHIDRNKLNNCCDNLRYVTQAQNNMNSSRSDKALEHYGFRPSSDRRKYATIWAREHRTAR